MSRVVGSRVCPGLTEGSPHLPPIAGPLVPPIPRGSTGQCGWTGEGEMGLGVDEVGSVGERLG